MGGVAAVQAAVKLGQQGGAGGGKVSLPVDTDGDGKVGPPPPPVLRPGPPPPIDRPPVPAR